LPVIVLGSDPPVISVLTSAKVWPPILASLGRDDIADFDVASTSVRDVGIQLAGAAAVRRA
jgi:hypothetical protein